MTNNLSPDMFDEGGAAWPNPLPLPSKTIRLSPTPAPTAATLRPSAEPKYGLVYASRVGPGNFPAALGTTVPWINCGYGKQFPQWPTRGLLDLVAPGVDASGWLLIDGEPELDDREEHAHGGNWISIALTVRRLMPSAKLCAYDAFGVQPWWFHPWMPLPRGLRVQRWGEMQRIAPAFGAQKLPSGEVSPGFDAIGTDIYVPPGYDERGYLEWARLKLETNCRLAKIAGISEVWAKLNLRDTRAEDVGKPNIPWDRSVPISQSRMEMQVKAVRAWKDTVAGVRVRFKLWGSAENAGMLREDEVTAAAMCELLK